jgi:hypothetical protein
LSIISLPYHGRHTASTHKAARHGDVSIGFSYHLIEIAYRLESAIASRDCFIDILTNSYSLVGGANFERE